MPRATALILVVAGGLTLAACHHNVPAPALSSSRPLDAAAPTRVSRVSPPLPPAPAARPAPAPARLSEAELFGRMTLDELNTERPLADVFFDYNQNLLGDEARTVLQRDALWLNKWPQTRILIQGHCDERGTAEYNLALGDRRAVTVRDYLASLGIGADRIVTRSLGKESPFCQGATEACWSQNRRGHFLITAK